MNDSEFLYHTNCDNCGSKDNLAVYTDHVWCFGCHFFENRRTKNWKVKKHTNGSMSLPDDYEQHLPVKALNWVNQYGITGQEMQRHRFGWSEAKQYLVFPVYDVSGNLLMWQGRYFGDNPDHPKYITKGAKDVLHICGENGIIILVEDLLSAIKVGRQFRGLPIWGSSINLSVFMHLLHLSDECLIWLDHNMLGESQKAANRARQWFRRVDVIDTPLDPKQYSNAEIKQFVEKV